MAYAVLRMGTIDSPLVLEDLALQMYNLVYGDRARMEQANAQGGVIGWVTPDYSKMHMAWNAIRYVAFQLLYEVGGTQAPDGAPKALVDGMDVYFFVNIDYTGSYGLTVESADGGQYSLSADGMKTEYEGVQFLGGGKAWGGAQFDVMVFARTSFRRITWQTDNSLTWLMVNPAYPYVRLYILNGVVQQGESSQKDWLTDGVRLLTRQTILQPCGEAQAEVTLLEVTDGTPSVGRQAVQDETDVASINLLLGADVLTWAPGCKGVALRWLNDQGGVDGYVFTPKSRRQRKAKTSGVVNLYTPDPYQVKDTVTVYDVEAEDLMVLGVDGLPRQQYDVLRWLPLSRDIVIYRPEVSVPGNRWQSVTVEDYNVEDSVEQNAVDIEITIRMPKLNLQV